jgi:L-lysine 2,3-aminomutase
MPSKSDFSQIITSIDELLQLLALKRETTRLLPSVVKNFPLQVPYDFVAKMAKGDINDPLLCQILPRDNEKEIFNDYSMDPLGEKAHSPVHGLIHKYPNRALLLTTNNCFINCRFCFRRFCNDYIQNWQEIFDYISNNAMITEVILSGGDPLCLSDEKIAAIIAQFATIPHLRRLRIHTRAPIVYPQRITQKLLDALILSRFSLVMVVHCNHPNEIDVKVANAVKLLKSGGISLYNQSVLLKGINDDTKVLTDLCEKLFANGIQPYYMHLLDKVIGAQHFDVDINIARQILQQITLILPGYLVPKLVYETPKTLTKILVGPPYASIK